MALIHGQSDSAEELGGELKSGALFWDGTKFVRLDARPLPAQPSGLDVIDWVGEMMHVEGRKRGDRAELWLGEMMQAAVRKVRTARGPMPDRWWPL